MKRTARLRLVKIAEKIGNSGSSIVVGVTRFPINLIYDCLFSFEVQSRRGGPWTIIFTVSTFD